MKIILASQSPRRKQLLGYLVPSFEQQSADIDESVLDNEDPQHYVERLANQKAVAIFNKIISPEDSLVIGSDTTVVNNGEILGKPESLEECISMLMALSGKEHQVMTAYSVVTKAKTVTKTVITSVLFATVTEQQVIDYWHTGEPQDKAGSYAIQGIGGKFVTSINGSVSAVVGLPLVELDATLKEFK
ncbi:Maf family protein [Psychrosphaera haliotis]|uniref:Maf family protein n=1 Tax=Psychrosphaera haliotis TaxID=555083 RepID=UPI0031D36D7B